MLTLLLLRLKDFYKKFLKYGITVSFYDSHYCHLLITLVITLFKTVVNKTLYLLDSKLTLLVTYLSQFLPSEHNLTLGDKYTSIHGLKGLLSCIFRDVTREETGNKNQKEEIAFFNQCFSIPYSCPLYSHDFGNTLNISVKL